jgi:proteasome Rpn11 subunit JAMM motif . Metallo peptidase. MEROPS family M67B
MSRQGAVGAIATDAMAFARACAADQHPDEFMGLLRADPALASMTPGDSRVVTDVLVLPGTTSSPVQATIRSVTIPNEQAIVGSVHSHPNGVLTPSDTDRRSFGSGPLHIILGAPYGPADWRAYDRTGTHRALRTVDVDLPDPASFFDFTEDDLDLPPEDA